MRTDRAVARMSSDWVAMRPTVNRMTDRRLWKHYLPLLSVTKSEEFYIDSKQYLWFKEMVSLCFLILDIQSLVEAVLEALVVYGLAWELIPFGVVFDIGGIFLISLRKE